MESAGAGVRVRALWIASSSMVLQPMGAAVPKKSLSNFILASTGYFTGIPTKEIYL